VIVVDPVGVIDEWAVFFRNWGNEGWCSQRDQLLDRQTLKLQLPWIVGATSELALTRSTAHQAPPPTAGLPNGVVIEGTAELGGVLEALHRL
jgi:SH3-like domain-containing protein